jgi:hypothetical protein
MALPHLLEEKITSIKEKVFLIFHYDLPDGFLILAGVPKIIHTDHTWFCNSRTTIAW